MRKTVALILALILMFSFGGCSALPEENSVSPDLTAPGQSAEPSGENGQSVSEQSQSAGPEMTDASGETAEPEAPAVYTLALDGGCSSLNYFKPGSASAAEIMTNCVIGLTEPDRYGVAVTEASDRISVNEDRTVWTFHIRSGLEWVDNNGIPSGYPVTARDFLDSARLQADPAGGMEIDDYIINLVSGLGEYRSALANLDAGGESTRSREEIEADFETAVGVKMVDEYTIQYVLTENSPHFSSLLQSSRFFMPVELEYYLEQGEEFGSDIDKILYCGPYVVSHFEKDKRVTLTANPAYFAADQVTIKTVEYIAVEQGRSQAEMFMDGKLSYADVTVDDYISMQHSEWEHCLLPASTSVSTDCMFLNFRSKNPEFAAFVQNADFRRALQLSIDRMSLAYLKDPINPSSVIRGTITPENCISDPSGEDYTDRDALKSYKDAELYKPDEAKKAMQAAVSALCSSDGSIAGIQGGKVDCRPVGTFRVDGKLPVQMLYVCGDDNDSIILAHFFESVIEESIGTEYIDVEIVCISDWTRSSVVDGNNFDLIMQPVTTAFPDPSATLTELVPGGTLNYGAFSLDTYNMLVESSLGVDDFSMRLDIFSRAEAFLLHENCILPLTSSDNACCMSRSRPFTGGLATFGSRRLKGIELTAAPVTSEEYSALLEEYRNSR